MKQGMQRKMEKSCFRYKKKLGVSNLILQSSKYLFIIV